MYILVIIGAAIIIFLGIAHGVFTLRSTPQGGPMMPTDPQVRESMQVVGGLGLAPNLQTTLWKAWIGFNLSHSLGVLVVGMVIGLPVVLNLAIPANNPVWIAAALSLPWVYLWISRRYWFSQPTRGIAVAAGLISIGILASLF